MGSFYRIVFLWADTITHEFVCGARYGVDLKRSRLGSWERSEASARTAVRRYGHRQRGPVTPHVERYATNALRGWAIFPSSYNECNMGNTKGQEAKEGPVEEALSVQNWINDGGNSIWDALKEEFQMEEASMDEWSDVLNDMTESEIGTIRKFELALYSLDGVRVTEIHESNELRCYNIYYEAPCKTSPRHGVLYALHDRMEWNLWIGPL
ncbi:hypothetical protein TorRG33x02_215530 [Trema orientale]|uniref:Uncharacterized protein n=1 Tax=Trema orientale TaxID=63057 RepID=A0A2P5EAT2_TREOI|nr:hypothetical protein TorRG33x02_215530 [Trema orientale]